MSTHGRRSSSLCSTSDSLYRTAPKESCAYIQLQTGTSLTRRCGLLPYWRPSEPPTGCGTFDFLEESEREVSACGQVTLALKRQSSLSRSPGGFGDLEAFL